MTDESRAEDRADAEFTYDDGSDSRNDPADDADHDPSDRADPLEDLAAAIEETDDAERTRSTDPDFDDLFDRRDAAEIDGERLWDRLEGDDPDEMPVPVDRAIREVEKRSYCQGCEYFAEPPDVACTHETAEILSVPTTETFRVADCPFVLEDEALEGED